MNRRQFNRLLAASPAAAIRIPALAAGASERPWIGPQFWANPLQDWRLRDGRIECFVSGGDRNVCLLTHDVVSAPGTLELKVKLGRMDGLFFPDRATAPQFANYLERAGVPKTALIIGSADWDGDQSILSTRYLNGAVYPAVDPTGLKTLAPQYAAKFGGTPNPLATIAYTAVTLANAGPLAKAKPRYSAAALTAPAGFNGRDGVFRLLPSGENQYALVMKQVTAGGAVVVDGPKL